MSENVFLLHVYDHTGPYYVTGLFMYIYIRFGLAVTLDVIKTFIRASVCTL